MPNSRAAVAVSPYHLSPESRELLKQRGQEIRTELAHRRADRIWPQVPAYTGKRLAWPGTMLAAACLFSTVSAQATEWQHVAETPDGTTWSVRRGTEGRELFKSQNLRVAMVRRVLNGGAQLFKAGALEDAATRQHSEVHLFTLASALVETTHFTRGDRSVAAALALVLCRGRA